MARSLCLLLRASLHRLPLTRKFTKTSTPQRMRSPGVSMQRGTRRQQEPTADARPAGVTWALPATPHLSAAGVIVAGPPFITTAPSLLLPCLYPRVLLTRLPLRLHHHVFPTTSSPTGILAALSLLPPGLVLSLPDIHHHRALAASINSYLHEQLAYVVDVVQD